MEIEINIDIDNGDRFVSLLEAGSLGDSDLAFFKKHEAGNIIIKYEEQTFCINQLFIGDVFTNMFLPEMQEIVESKPLQITTCGQENISYKINSPDKETLVLKYVNRNELEPEDDYYAREGYDSEIVLPKIEFLGLLYQRAQEFSEFEIKNRNFLWDIEDTEYMNNLHIKAEKALASIGVPFKPYRISYERLKELNKIKIEK